MQRIPRGRGTLEGQSADCWLSLGWFPQRRVGASGAPRPDRSSPLRFPPPSLLRALFAGTAPSARHLPHVLRAAATRSTHRRRSGAAKLSRVGFRVKIQGPTSLKRKTNDTPTLTPARLYFYRDSKPGSTSEESSSGSHFLASRTRLFAD